MHCKHVEFALRARSGCGKMAAFLARGAIQVRRLVIVALWFAGSSLAHAAGNHAVHTTAATHYSPRARAATGSAPAYHPATNQSRSFTPAHAHPMPTAVRPTYTGSRPELHTGGRPFTSPARREIARHVRFHGGLLALPALGNLNEPVLLNVPGIGDISIDEVTYSGLYPLLLSDDEADRERAYRQLQERIERERGSSVQQASIGITGSWDEFIDKVAKVSADQNGGSAALSRLCQPELDNCILGLEYSLEDGRKGLAVVIQDTHGKVQRREVCEFNAASDARNCVDWDSGAKHSDAKNAEGNWIQRAQLDTSRHPVAERPLRPGEPPVMDASGNALRNEWGKR
jgi:hypothetical protein